MGCFAVIDTETNWADEVMSIGTVIADTEDFRPLAAKYHILPEPCQVGGMYENVLFLETPVKPILCSREAATAELQAWLAGHGVSALLAYNACFDRNHLPELRSFSWYDIMRIAIYRQHNPKIPACAECYSTGRMKRNYGVEPMLRLLAEDPSYRETHNALWDALDELRIVRLLGRSISEYIPLI